MVVSLIQLVSDLPDVSRYHHKVSVGEADQYVAVAVPSTGTQGGKEQTLLKTSHRRHCGLVSSGKRRCGIPAVGHNVSVVTLEGQFNSVVWVADVEEHEDLFVHGYTDLKVLIHIERLNVRYKDVFMFKLYILYT